MRIVRTPSLRSRSSMREMIRGCHIRYDPHVITNERDDADLWYAIACGVLLAVAAAIRFRSLGTTLFEDEVWVAELVRNGGWHAHSWSTPPLFYAICRGWSSLRGVSN